ncbi:MAG: HPr family phosphocarrier protein [Planctomycetia bacterium]|nr:HPr family phosphocarrier protein [Planctomycetia bacterium]
MQEFSVTLQATSGLHARPATELVRLLKPFASEIILQKGERRGNAKSLIQCLKLGLIQGDTITFHLDGTDEEEALGTLKTFFKQWNMP